MDVWLRPTNENKERVLKALNEFQLTEDGIKAISEIDFTEIVMFHVGVRPERIDFLGKVPGLKFDEAFKRKLELNVAGLSIPVLHLDDLIISKLLADRPQDKADISKLQDINRSKKD